MSANNNTNTNTAAGGRRQQAQQQQAKQQQQQQPPPPPAAWEYDSCWVSDGSFAEVANERGAAGWELVAVLPRRQPVRLAPAGDSGWSDGSLCFWKRPAGRRVAAVAV